MTTNGENQAPAPAPAPEPATGSAAGSRAGAFGAAALAVVLLLALLDAAVETFWGGSPLRWRVVPLVLLFVAVVGYLWRPGGALLRRGGPGSAAATLFAGTLVLLAGTAWMPGGQADGVRMLGQSTPTVLAAALLAAVVLAAWAIVRGFAFLPTTPRLVVQSVVVLIGIYALAAFGLAIKEQAGFAALFQGGALWQRLPRWLQGTFVGALVLVPAAILVQFGRIGGHIRGGQPVRILIHQTTALVMSFVMALSGVIVPAAATGSTTTRPTTGPAGARPPDVPPPTVEELAQSQQQLFGKQDPAKVGEALVRAAEEELSKPGMDPSDIGARASALGRDAGRIFDFLRDQVAIEPYVGVLRGARGTLAAGAGNALDRALLAQGLLEAAGVESRLVAGTLSASQADTLLARFLAAGPSPALPAGGDRKAQDTALDTAARDVAAKAGLPPDAVDATLRRAAQRSDAFMWKVEEERAVQHEFLSGQLRNAGVNAPADRQAVLNELRDRMKAHYWLQVKAPSGDWTDFDPSFADSRPGSAYASRPSVLARVPADRFHRFDVQVVYRTKSGGRAKSEVLLKRSVASADALFSPMELRIQPGEAIAQGKALRAMDARQRADMLRAIKRYQTLVRDGSNVVGGRAFDLEGHTYDPKGGGLMGGGPGGMMGGMLGFGGEPEAVEFLDVQFVLRLSGPGRAPATQTRTLVRAADVASPTFAPPIGEWQVLVQPQWISADLAGFQMLSHAVGVARGMTAALKARKGLADVVLPPPVPHQLLEFALLRQSATGAILARQSGLKAFVDAPMLTIAGHKLSALRPDEGRILAERTIDIVENGVRFVATDDRSEAAVFDAALTQGAADCTLEQRLLQDAFPDSTAESGATIMQRVQLERRPILLAGARDADKLRSAGLAETDIEWIGANESPRARLLVAKASQGPAAWWSVQPDGTAVLRVSGGQGQAHAEHEIDVNLVALKILAALVCGVEIAGAVSHGGGGGRGIFTIIWCIVATQGSAIFFVMQLHAWSWALIVMEGAVFLGTQIDETYGEGHE
jgi:transglutaminase-like putative cysteine protease